MIGFFSTRAGATESDLYGQAADASAPALRVGPTPGPDVTPKWLNDSTILFVAGMPRRGGRPGAHGDIYSVVLGRPGSEKALLESPFDEDTPSVDASGRWLLYRSR